MKENQTLEFKQSWCETIGLLEYKFLTKRILFEGIQRIEMDVYPSQAIREMLLNVLVHRTQIGSPIQIRIFDQQISIWNEGSLPNGLSIEDLRINHNSRPRNPIIANACFLAGYIDAWGRGTLKIINSCFDYGLSDPTIIEKNGGVEVTLFSMAKLQKGGQTDLDLGGQTKDKKGGQTTLDIGGQTKDKKGGQTNVELSLQTTLTPRQMTILNSIHNNPRITRKELSEILAVNESAIQKHLKALVDSGRLKRIGTFKGKWVIVKRKK